MNRVRQSVFARSFLLPLALLLWLSACHKHVWVPLDPPFGPAIEAEPPVEQMRVEVSGKTEVLRLPALKGDTLIGASPWKAHTSTEYRSPAALETLRIPLSDLKSVEVRVQKANPSATVALVLGLVVLVGGIALLIGAATVSPFRPL